MRTHIDISPAGGPYNVNSNSGWRDIQKLTAFTPIIPPSPESKKFRMWLPSSNSIIGYLIDEQLYPPSNNVYQLRTQNLNAAIRYREGPD